MELVGHRGARGLVAENTLAGFARALAIGIHALELDVHLSRDAVVVVHHDPCLDPDTTRDAAGHWLQAPSPVIHTLKFAELQQYRLCGPRPGSDYARLFPEQRIETPEPPPRLEQVIELIRASGNRQVRLIIELKLDPRTPGQGPGPVTLCDAVAEVLQQQDMLQRSCLQSFDWRAVLHVRQKYPLASHAFLTVERPQWNSIRASDGGDSPWTGDFQIRDYDNDLVKMIHAAGGEIWAPDYRELNAAKLAAAHDLGLRVVVWTVNQTAEMLEFMNMGVDGIISDYPDRLHLLMAQRGYTLPAASPLAVPPFPEPESGA